MDSINIFEEKFEIGLQVQVLRGLQVNSGQVKTENLYF